MPTLSEAMKPLRIADVPRLTPEEYERRKAAAMARNMICVPTCPVCGGLGWYNAGERLTLCPNVDPLAVYPSTRYGLDDTDRTLEWSAVKKWQNTLDAVKAVKQVLRRGYGWVYLWGPPGLGKTLTLKIAVAEMLRERKQAAYTRMAEILDDLRAAFDARNPSEESQRKLDWWASLPVLCIDEFDRVRATEYAAERRFLLMDRRYEQALREKSVTIMTSNASPETLDGYLYDRVADGRFTIVRLAGDSFRPGGEW